MRRWLKRIVIVLAIFVLPPLAFYFYASWQGERELRAAIAELDATGEPWRYDDLIAARPKLADKDNVRSLFMDVRKQVPSGFFMRKILEQALDRPSNAVMPPDEAEKFHEAMQEFAAALADARKIADMPNSRLHVSWPADATWPNLDDAQKAREFINLLQHAAAWHAQQGDLETAMQDCLAMQRTSQALQDEPTLIAQLVRIALQAISVHSLERVLAQGQPSAQQLQRVQEAWEQFDGQSALRKGFLGERAGSHRMFEALESGEEEMLHAFSFSRKGPVSAWVHITDMQTNLQMRLNLKHAHAWMLRHWTEVIKSLELPEAERAARHAVLENEARQAPGAARMLVPAWLKVSEANRRTEAQTRCASVALAAERFRIDHNHWPAVLADLSPKYLKKVPADPYAGMPLQLKATPDGLVIFSIGPDGKQSGNYQEQTAAKQYAIRYEFRLWHVPQRRQLLPREP